MKKKEKNCHFCKKDLHDITVTFKKRSDILTTGNTHFETKLKQLNFMIIIIIIKISILSQKPIW